MRIRGERLDNDASADTVARSFRDKILSTYGVRFPSEERTANVKARDRVRFQYSLRLESLAY